MSLQLNRFYSMSQLTPAFKLTLLLSFGVHLATFIQIGGTDSGYHPQTVNTRFSITLLPSRNATGDKTTRTNTANPVAKQASRSRKPASKPVSQTVGTEKSESSTPSRFDLPGPSTDSRVSQAKQVSGKPRAGLFARKTYREQLLRHLEKFKYYPFVARRRGLQGAVRMQIAVNRQGELRSVNCLSAASIFCHAAAESAHQAQPLPEPPQSPYQLEYMMEYKLHQ